jgi:alginate O-acetyltransferase complex protein AlgI
MVFSSPVFLFLYLPIVLGIYYVLPWRLKNVFLLGSSLLFYFLGERLHTWVMLLVIASNYVFGLGLLHSGGQTRRIIMIVCVVFNLSLLAYYKYCSFFVSVFNDLFSFSGMFIEVPTSIHLPIGISFFVFQALSYVIDVYRREVKVQRNPAKLGLYVSLFPQLIAGPIVRYSDVDEDIDQRRHTWSDFAYGVERFVFGLAKKVLIANEIAFYVDGIFAIPDEQLSTSLVWLGILGYALQIYFDFSAYSDMAIGLGRMIGFKFMENFDYPYIAQSIQEFWRRWHISLSTWFRDYVYIPLGGNRLGKFATYRNLLIVFFLTGLWHGASYNFIIWGFIHGTFLILERNGLGDLLKRLPIFLRSTYMIFVVLIGWVFFRANNLPQAFTFLKKMFVFESSPKSDAHFSFLVDANFLIMLALGIILATPVRRWLFGDCFYDKSFTPGLRLLSYNLVIAAAFLLSMVYLAAGTYNPFIYFRF